MIRRLPEALVREIAAGEVIADPSDVLRELVENAIDARARRIEVFLDGGGIRRILVRDDGQGIPRDALALALEAHATSKLNRLDRIETLGFRGEGLFAIRMAARIRLTSRPKDQLGGATVVAEGEEIRTLPPHPAPHGTEVEVTHLFQRLPARRRALEAPEIEGKRAQALLVRYILHHPGLRFRLVTDGEERFAYAGQKVGDAVQMFWGTVVANRMIEVEAGEGGFLLKGLISRPELTRARRDRLLLSVNGRPVAWPEPLLRAVLRAYAELLPEGHYPLGVLSLTLPPETVVVNTDPRKSRVRLLELGRVAEFVERMVADALHRHSLGPTLSGLTPVERAPEVAPGAWPRMRYLGSFRDLYLLAEAGDELWIVDQHAAHERVIYEELKARIRSEPPVTLEAPELVRLSADEETRLAQRQDFLRELGVSLEPFGPQRYRLRTVPRFLLGLSEEHGAFVRNLLAPGDPARLVRRVLGRLACLPAVKAGHALSRAGAQALLDALAKCELPWVCPHGRPTALRLTEFELARRFGRRGPRATAEQVTLPSRQVGKDLDPVEPEGS